MLAPRLPWAFFLRDLRIEVSYKAGFAGRVVSALFSVALLYFLARVFRNSTASSLEGYGGSYFSFAVLGLAFLAYMTLGIGGIASSIRDSQMAGTLELMVLSPTRLSAVLVASSLPAYVFALLSVLVYLGAGSALGIDLSGANVPFALLSLLVATASFVALGLFAAGLVFLTKRGNPVAWAIRSASVVLAGVFYPVDVLPGTLRAIGQILPLTHALELMRRSLLNGEGAAELWQELAALAALVIVLLPLGLAACRLAVRIARTDGSLTH